MFSRTKGTYADFFGRCPESLVQCPAVTQGTECSAVDRKTRPQSKEKQRKHAQRKHEKLKQALLRTPSYPEYLQADKCFMDGEHVTDQVN